LYSGGPYEDYNTELILDTFNITKKGCFHFTIYDSYGDGLQSGNVEGEYKILNEDAEIVFKGGNFKTNESFIFKLYKIPPKPTFTPTNGLIHFPANDRFLIGFGEIIRNIDDSFIINPDTLFVLKKVANEEEIVVDFVINNGRNTVYFDNDLEYWTSYYLGFKEGLEDVYDNPIPAEGITFRTEAEIVKAELIEEQVDFIIYPSPAKNYINIECLNPFTYKLYNEIGALIDTETQKNKHKKIDIKHLPQGIYILRIISENESFSKKIIKN